MRAKNLDDVLVYQKALTASSVVSALLARQTFRRNSDLADQLSRSAGRVAPLIAEGFGQLTDRHVAVYLGRARGSVLETIGHLQTAHNQQRISDLDLAEIKEMYVVIGKMLTRWINYLQRTDWKNRPKLKVTTRVDRRSTVPIDYRRGLSTIDRRSTRPIDY